MTEEQKARAYDEALEALKSKMKDFGEIIISREDIEQIFPGIVDEDENTRQEIVDFLRHCGINAEKLEKWFGWFDKQKKPDEGLPHCPDGNTKYDMEFSEAEEYIGRRGFDVPWNDCDIFVDGRFITQTVANVLAWADDHPKSDAEDILTAGDWLAPNDRSAGAAVQILKTFDGRCETETQNGGFGNHSMKHVREYYHKWTLADAREGNVLFSPFCKMIWIYKDENTAHFGINVGRCPVTGARDITISIPSDACPASKEQRELLQKIMFAAGYEWDASLLKLKKINGE